MDRRVTPSKRVTSPTWGPQPPCKQALKLCWELPRDFNLCRISIRTLCSFRKKAEIVINKIATVNQRTRDITGHFVSIAAGGRLNWWRRRQNWSPSQNFLAAISWLFRFMQGERQKDFKWALLSIISPCFFFFWKEYKYIYSRLSHEHPVVI